jgi:hypothetical protein
MNEASSTVSPNASYVRPHRSSRATATTGAKGKSAPTPADSSATARATSSTNPGSRVAPRPMLCGNTVAP